MGDIDVKTARVRAAAADTESLSRQVMRRLGHSLDISEELPSSHYGNGWESPAGLKACAEKWEEHLVSLAKSSATAVMVCSPPDSRPPQTRRPYCGRT